MRKRRDIKWTEGRKTTFDSLLVLFGEHEVIE
jgi:hypothetical protein